MGEWMKQGLKQCDVVKKNPRIRTQEVCILVPPLQSIPWNDTGKDTEIHSTSVSLPMKLEN